MRVLRRICGALRMRGNRISDAQVLWRLRAPRLVHLIRRNRLVYLASVLRAPACHLRALIAARKPDGSRQPWTEAVRADLVALWLHFSWKLSELGHPMECPDKWHHLIVSYPAAWKALVKSWIEPFAGDMAVTAGDRKRQRREEQSRRATAGMGDASHSLCVPHGRHAGIVASAHRGAEQAHPHRCAECERSFVSARALGMHNRKMHGARCDAKFFADYSGICPICRNMFRLAYG